MNKPLVKLFAVPIVVILAGFRITNYLMSPTSLPAGGGLSENENIYTGTSVMSHDAFLKIHALQSTLATSPSHTLSDADVDWLLQTRHAPHPEKPHAAAIARARPLEVLLKAGLSPAQKDKVFRAVMPDFRSRDKWGASRDRIGACDAVRTLHDKRGIPYLLPLLHYPDECVRTRAKQALDALATRHN